MATTTDSVTTSGIKLKKGYADIKSGIEQLYPTEGPEHGPRELE
jgi:hypothetical protein